MRRNAKFNVISLTVAVFPVHVVTRQMTEQGSGLDISKLLYLVIAMNSYISQNSKYLVIAITKILSPTPAPPLKNIWNSLGGNSLFLLICMVMYVVLRN